ncbi:MAG: cyclase family protein [Lautropia sp.]|nr:cyclase family protein [Lautropia sp.]
MKAQFLSYPLDVNAPGFPGEPTLTVEYRTRINQGDVYNSSVLHLFNHFGTHFDAPKHFVDHGPSLAELPIERFIYDRPLLVDMPKGKRSLVDPADLEPWMPAVAQADCLIIRTGLEALRASDPVEYAANGCAFSIDAAQYLIDHAPHLKAVGFDFISLASPAHAEHGVRAHQILLGMDTRHFICIIEDMMLAHVDRSRLVRVIAMPLRVNGVDSGQVSILAESRDRDAV